MNNLNLKLLVKRMLAYMIDIIIITIFATLITYIPLFNKQNEKYQKIYDEFQEIYTEYTSTTVLLNDSYNDKMISEEEYQKLLEKETYKNIIEEKYIDLEINEDEYEEIKEYIEDKYNSISKDYNYKLQKLGIYNSIIILISTLLYFGILQYFLKGETIGKKVMYLKVVSANNKKINILNYLLRCLIINNILFNAISILFLTFSSETIYNKADNVISFLVSIVEAIIIFLVITREDHRGLHDLICNTKVIPKEK